MYCAPDVIIIVRITIIYIRLPDLILIGGYNPELENTIVLAQRPNILLTAIYDL